MPSNHPDVRVIYVSESDPGNVGPGVEWFKTSTGALAFRNSSNSGWDYVASDLAFPPEITPVDDTEGGTVRINLANGDPSIQLGPHSNTAISGLWFGNITPSDSNYAVLGDGNNLYFNAASSVGLTVGGQSKIAFSTSDMSLVNGYFIRFDADILMYRDEADAMAFESGGNPVKFRLYHAYPTLTDYERLALQTGSDYVELAAETAGSGADNFDVRLTPAGAGKVRFGSHSALAAETVTGYITIKDSGGVSRKLAVVS